jgi:hypothetical protein
MTVKYQVTSQLDGLPRQAMTFSEAKELQKQVRDEYMRSIESCFSITVMIQNEDESWTYAVADENGEPIVPPIVPEVVLEGMVEVPPEE